MALDTEKRIVINKSYEDSDSGEWLLEGIASDGSVDDAGEIVDQATMDISRLKTVNWNHKNDPAYQIGEVVSKTLTANGLYVKVKLYKDMEIAKDIWTLAKAMKNSGNNTLEFSLQGMATKVGNRLMNGKFNKVSICMTGMNKNTNARIVAKSLDIDDETFERVKANLFEENALTVKNIIDNIKTVVSKSFKRNIFTVTKENLEDKENQKDMTLDELKAAQAAFIKASDEVLKSFEATAKAAEPAAPAAQVEKSLDAEALAAKVSEDIKAQLEVVSKSFQDTLTAQKEAADKEISELKAKLTEVEKSFESKPEVKGIPAGAPGAPQFVTKSYTERFPLPAADAKGTVLDINMNKEVIRAKMGEMVTKSFESGDTPTYEALSNSLQVYTLSNVLNDDALNALAKENITVAKREANVA